MTARMFTFIGGGTGPWRIVRLEAVAGESLERVPRLDVVKDTTGSLPSGVKWLLRGVTSSERYTTRQEQDLLIARQPALGRPEATCAALIPVKKSASWWGLAQDERRAVFEEQSERRSEEWRYVEREVDIRLVREVAA